MDYAVKEHEETTRTIAIGVSDIHGSSRRPADSAGSEMCCQTERMEHEFYSKQGSPVTGAKDAWSQPTETDAVEDVVRPQCTNAEYEGLNDPSPSSLDLVASVPVDVKELIFVKLDLKDLLRTRLVSKHWKHISSTQRFAEVYVVSSPRVCLNWIVENLRTMRFRTINVDDGEVAEMWVAIPGHPIGTGGGLVLMQNGTTLQVFNPFFPSNHITLPLLQVDTLVRRPHSSLWRAEYDEETPSTFAGIYISARGFKVAIGVLAFDDWTGGRMHTYDSVLGVWDHPPMAGTEWFLPVEFTHAAGVVNGVLYVLGNTHDRACSVIVRYSFESSSWLSAFKIQLQVDFTPELFFEKNSKVLCVGEQAVVLVLECSGEFVPPEGDYTFFKDCFQRCPCMARENDCRFWLTPTLYFPQLGTRE